MPDTYEDTVRDSEIYDQIPADELKDVPSTNEILKAFGDYLVSNMIS